METNVTGKQTTKERKRLKENYEKGKFRKSIKKTIKEKRKGKKINVKLR